MKLIRNSQSAVRNGFTLVEVIVLLGIGIILLSIFLPYLLKIREGDRRARCASNLQQIYSALSHYAKANGYNYPRVVYDEANNPNGYTAFTGADDPSPFAPDSAVRPNDVTASLWLMLRAELLNDPSVFICPSSNDSRDLLTDAAGRFVKPVQRGNFRRANNLSYSYSSPFSNAPGYRMNDTRSGDFALMADKGPPAAVDEEGALVGPGCEAPPIEMAKANSRNHGGAGQNVLHAQGWVYFERTPYAGVGRTRDASTGRVLVSGDNIYTALSPKPLAGDKPPANANGYWGRHIGPAWEGDSYLVPTADDVPGAAPPATVPATEATPTLPATAPSTTTSTTTQSSATVPASQ